MFPDWGKQAQLPRVRFGFINVWNAPVSRARFLVIVLARERERERDGLLGADLASDWM